MARRPTPAPRLRPGDRVIRRQRTLKTWGTVVRLGGEDRHGAACVWVRWSHPTTLPNPSREPIDDLELVEGSATTPAHPADNGHTDEARSMTAPPDRPDRGWNGS